MSIKKRLALALGVTGVSALLLTTVASVSGAKPGAPRDGSSLAAVPATSSVATNGIPCPAAEAAVPTGGCSSFPVSCCSGGSVPGVTATGQATVKGAGSAIRDRAIRQAVADARDQAEAAGVSLGQILAMQISTSGYPYPLMTRPGIPLPGVGTGAAPPACLPERTCARRAPVPFQTSVSISITWAIR